MCLSLLKAAYNPAAPSETELPRQRSSFDVPVTRTPTGDDTFIDSVLLGDITAQMQSIIDCRLYFALECSTDGWVRFLNELPEQSRMEVALCGHVSRIYEAESADPLLRTPIPTPFYLISLPNSFVIMTQRRHQHILMPIDDFSTITDNFVPAEQTLIADIRTGLKSVISGHWKGLLFTPNRTPKPEHSVLLMRNRSGEPLIMLMKGNLHYAILPVETILFGSIYVYDNETTQIAVAMNWDRCNLILTTFNPLHSVHDLTLNRAMHPLIAECLPWIREQGLRLSYGFSLNISNQLAPNRTVVRLGFELKPA